MSLSPESAVILSIAMNGLTWIVLAALALRQRLHARAKRERHARWAAGVTAKLKRMLEASGQDPCPSALRQPHQAYGGSNAQR